jgi:hypothetical protein
MMMTYRSLAKLGLIAVAATAISGSAFAQHPVQRQDYRALYNEPDSFTVYNHGLYGMPCGLACGRSGTSGRLGLGADPAHPEGPGNFSN